MRGPITGWRASDSTIIKLGNDVVLVDVDDETWRILSEGNIIWPYPRGDIWAKVINNSCQFVLLEQPARLNGITDMESL